MSASKADPSTLELRAKPPRVVRLKRSALVVAATLLGAVVLAATLWSLRRDPSEQRPPLYEPQQIDRLSRPDGLEQLPADYSKVVPPKPVTTAPIPKLGPPLPGDLGAAMLNAETARAERDIPGVSPAPLRPDPVADAARAERINRLREADEAAKSALFFRGNEQHSQRREMAGNRGERSTDHPGLDDGAAATANNTATTPSKGSPVDEKRQFIATQNVAKGQGAALQLPASPYLLSPGTIIAAALVTGIDSDLPGPALASVTEPVYDSATGTHLLIPQGARLIGEYDSQVGFGQRRVLLVWNRLVFPDASSLALDRAVAADTSGRSGLEDEVDRHWRELLAGAALSTLIGIGAELAAPDRTGGQSQVIVATRQGVQDSVNQVGQELARRNLNVQPTLKIRPGYPLRVIVSKDLILRPYQPLFIERSKP